MPNVTRARVEDRGKQHRRSNLHMVAPRRPHWRKVRFVDRILIAVLALEGMAALVRFAFF